MYADTVRPSGQSSPRASRRQHGLPSSSIDKFVESVPETPLLPSPVFTNRPGHAKSKTLRAAGQSSLHSPAKSKAQHIKAVVRESVQRVEVISALEASDWAAVQNTPQEQDLNAAGILVEVAKEQHPISPAQKVGNLSVIRRGTPDANASMQYTRKCPLPSCAFHLDRGFWSKMEKDNHIITHFEGQIGFTIFGNRHSLPWPNFIEDPESYFHRIEIFKRRVGQYYILIDPETQCHICLRKFDLSGYVEHLDDCVVQEVRAQALGTAQTCPVSTCEHDPPKISWGSRTDEPVVKHFVPSLGCSQCYQIQCQCPPIQREKSKSSEDEFMRSINDFELGGMGIRTLAWLSPGMLI